MLIKQKKLTESTKPWRTPRSPILADALVSMWTRLLGAPWTLTLFWSNNKTSGYNHQELESTTLRASKTLILAAKQSYDPQTPIIDYTHKPLPIWDTIGIQNSPGIQNPNPRKKNGALIYNHPTLTKLIPTNPCPIGIQLGSATFRASETLILAARNRAMIHNHRTMTIPTNPCPIHGSVSRSTRWRENRSERGLTYWRELLETTRAGESVQRAKLGGVQEQAGAGHTHRRPQHERYNWMISSCHLNKSSFLTTLSSHWSSAADADSAPLSVQIHALRVGELCHNVIPAHCGMAGSRVADSCKMCIFCAQRLILPSLGSWISWHVGSVTCICSSRRPKE